MKEMIVEKGGKEIMAGGHRMRVPREMEIDILHGDHLGLSSAGASPFYPEHGAQRWLPERDDSPMAQSRESHGQTDRCCRLSLTQRCRIDGRHKHIPTQPPVLEAIQYPQNYLGLIRSVQDEFLGVKTELTAYLDDGPWSAGLRAFEMTQGFHSRSIERRRRAVSIAQSLGGA